MDMTIDTQKQTAITNRASNNDDHLFDIRNVIAQMQKDAINWKHESDKGLYKVLYSCLLTLNRINAIDSISMKENVMSELDAMLEEKQLTVKSKKLANKVVQLVFSFDMDRRQISKYATCVNKFIETKKEYTSFISWLTENGGYNGVNSSKSKTAKSGLTQTQKIELVNVDKVETETTIENSFNVETTTPFVLYCVPNAEGNIDVKKVVTDTKFINPITASFYDDDLAKRNAEDSDEEILDNLQKAS